MYLDRFTLRPVIIAEIGVNHNGDLELAKKMTFAAKASGADVVKFQTFSTSKLVSRDVPLAEYQHRNIGRTISQFDMIRDLELKREELTELLGFCHHVGIPFLSSVGDTDSADFLVQSGVDTIKIGSGDLTNTILLRCVAQHGCSVLLSTGMGTLGEVEAAVDTLEQAGCRDITLFHCTSDYPAAFSDVNLLAMETLKRAFGLPVGYSDHTVGTEVAIGATAMGAVAIEKHFTTNRALPGPDQKASTTPEEFSRMVEAIRNLTAALGSSRKAPTRSEMSIRDKVRKSLVAAVPIPRNAVLTSDMLATMRVGKGLPPSLERMLIGSVAKCDIEQGKPLTLGMFDLEAFNVTD